ncbi:MAG: ATP-binding cassette domain-containing protein [Lachnospiraceae bacterium]|nr:ATP-binding cassette domain-containing protein [Lachnospiraceae bacterium]
MILEAKGLTKYYGKKAALVDFTYAFRPGIYGLLGPNGAGKSTLMGIMTTNLIATEGELYLDGRNIRVMGKEYRRFIGYMPQQQKLYDGFSLERFLYYIAALKGIDKKSVAEDVERTIHAVNLWDAREDTIGTYSGGMRQRALLAQAILGNPQIVVMDEPTVGLDPKERVNFRELVASIAEERTVIIATHIVSDLEKLASEIIFLSHGHIVESGTMEELLARYRETMEEPSVEKIYMRLNEGDS